MPVTHVCVNDNALEMGDAVGLGLNVADGDAASAGGNIWQPGKRVVCGGSPSTGVVHAESEYTVTTYAEPEVHVVPSK